MAAQRVYGYPRKTASGYALADGHGKVIGHGHLVNCTRIRPGQRGDWISSARCSYRFKVDGQWYAGRGYGEGMSFSGRAMKRPPTGWR